MANALALFVVGHNPVSLLGDEIGGPDGQNSDMGVGHLRYFVAIAVIYAQPFAFGIDVGNHDGGWFYS